VPPGLVEIHVAGSVVVWIAVLSFHLGLFAHPEPLVARSTPPEIADHHDPLDVGRGAT
jgi:hypothetical protein